MRRRWKQLAAADIGTIVSLFEPSLEVELENAKSAWERSRMLGSEAGDLAKYRCIAEKYLLGHEVARNKRFAALWFIRAANLELELAGPRPRGLRSGFLPCTINSLGSPNKTSGPRNIGFTHNRIW